MSSHLVHVTYCMHCSKELKSSSADGVEKQKARHARNCMPLKRAMFSAAPPETHAHDFTISDDMRSVHCVCGLTLNEAQMAEAMQEAGCAP